MLHVPGDIVDVGDHVPGHLGPQGVTIEIQGHVGGRGAHGNTQHLQKTMRVKFDKNVYIQEIPGDISLINISPSWCFPRGPGLSGVWWAPAKRTKFEHLIHSNSIAGIPK